MTDSVTSIFADWNVRFYAEKKFWGDGPWKLEPDKWAWIDPSTDIPCMVFRNALGALNGYVALPQNHPLYGKPCAEVNNYACRELSFAVPSADAKWWIVGFDCSGAGYWVPLFHGVLCEETGIRKKYKEGRLIYADITAVHEQVTRLALELANHPITIEIQIHV